MNKEEVLTALLSAVESCEELLSYAQEAYAAFRDGEHYLAWQILQKAHGYGYFDDEHHQNMILDYINKERKEQNND